MGVPQDGPRAALLLLLHCWMLVWMWTWMCKWEDGSLGRFGRTI